eukprot:755162-Hanusia_phi.AAC.2
MGMVYGAITLDSMLMGFDDTSVERNPSSPLLPLLAYSNWVVMSFFTVEVALKMFAYGVYRRRGGQRGGGDITSSMKEEEEEEDDDGKNGYFSSSWNIFDFSIVALSWLLILYQQLLDGRASGKMARALRVARPLRAFRAMEGTRHVLLTFPKAILDIRDVLSLLLFIFLVYAILGLNLFGLDGKFHGRCVVEEGDEYGTHGFLLLGRYDYSAPVCGSSSYCPSGFRCSCKADVLPDGSLQPPPYAYQDPQTGDPGCLLQPSPRPWADGGRTPDPVCPNYGFACFDNFALAIFTIFTSITMDSWSNTMWWGEDATEDFVSILYFSSLVGIVAFNIVNLNTAVISSAYRRVREEAREANKARERRRKQEGSSRLLQLQLRVSAWIKEGERRRDQPMNGMSLLVRKITMYPQEVDECGETLPSDLLHGLRSKNLRVSFGPDRRQWRVRAGDSQLVLLMSSSDEGEELGVIRRFKKEEVVGQGMFSDDNYLELRELLSCLHHEAASRRNIQFRVLCLPLPSSSLPARPTLLVPHERYPSLPFTRCSSPPPRLALPHSSFHPLSLLSPTISLLSVA